MAYIVWHVKSFHRSCDRNDRGNDINDRKLAGNSMYDPRVRRRMMKRKFRPEVLKPNPQRTFLSIGHHVSFEPHWCRSLPGCIICAKWLRDCHYQPGKFDFCQCGIRRFVGISVCDPHRACCPYIDTVLRWHRRPVSYWKLVFCC